MSELLQYISEGPKLPLTRVEYEKENCLFVKGQSCQNVTDKQKICGTVND